MRLYFILGLISVLVALTNAQTTHIISVTSTGNGAVLPSGTVVVNDGDDQSFTFTPDDHYHVADVIIDFVSMGAIPSYTISNVTADHTISVSFAPNSYTISANAGSNGTIFPGGISTLSYGNSQYYTITSNIGYHITDLIVDGVSVGPLNNYSFSVVGADHTISAVFAIDTYSITASAGAHGSVDPAGSASVNYSDSKTFSFSPDAHYHIANVLVDGSTVGNPSSYTFNNVTADHTLSVSFAIDQYTIEAGVHGNGSITPSGTTQLNYGSSQTYAITPAVGNHIDSIQIDGVTIGTPLSYDFQNVQAAHTIDAYFSLNQYTITATAGANGSISPAGSIIVGYDNTLAVSIIPATAYHVANVIVDGNSVGAVTSYWFTNISADHTISATFAPGTFSKYFGGSYDGFTKGQSSLAGLNGDPVTTAKYFGGSYDGYSQNITNRLSLNGNALTDSKYFGGSYDGSADSITRRGNLAGILLTASKYYGGSYDGFSMVTSIEIQLLPVHLVSFSGTSQRLNAELRWKTATEQNNYGYDVERRIKNSDSWIRSGFVAGSGTSNSPKEYSFVDRRLEPVIYEYRLKQLDHDGRIQYSSSIEVHVGTAPKVFELAQNYPNPFNPSTTIGFTLQVSGLTTLKIYDALGREVSTLLNENLEAGVYHERTFNASALASGIYFARLVSGDRSQIKKMLLMK